MHLDILFTVAFTSFIQSIFGVGVLILGTPLLMIQGYSFHQSLIILLPISLLINLLQIYRDHKSIDFGFYKKILIFTTPFIVFFLTFTTEYKINIGVIVGILLVLVAAKDFSIRAKKIINFFLRYEKIYLIMMGIVHGLTNLGGSLLTALVHAKNYKKITVRATIASSYATFAVIQIITLFVSKFDIDIKLSIIVLNMGIGLTIFLVTEKIIFADINVKAYRKLFSGFIFFSGLLLIIRSLF